MKAKLRLVGDVAVLDLAGKIMIGAGDVVLRDRVDDLLDEGRRKILLNLGRVTYMDSAGIGELMACYKRVSAAGGAVKLLNPTGRLYDQLHVTKLQDIFEIFTDEKLALVSFG